MMGPPSSRGVNYRCLTEVMKLCEARKATHVNKVTVSLLEAYNDSLRDLLADDSGKSAEPLQLRAEATAQAYIERYGHAPGAHTMRVHWRVSAANSLARNSGACSPIPHAPERRSCSKN